ncbi:GreA/GreB family transcription elongation factor [Prosthecobacter fusiformis]|uniref:GreA/GreB family transcription elongation factor n=1 Tax=Prosthecobacter fusiformis TaxID=48464 RepID=A0A4R7RK67_9BACT|nr:GreA/GreB family elongation factor [Prosthecobacter fusiformis]TDU63142.1 GreA/GreB family transcription elongation factor [Prosthecobacter fusiformis]
MSRAFVKEDIEIPERTTRRRSVSGLPPGALNLMTAKGAQQLRTRLAELQQASRAPSEILHLKQTLESVTVVESQAAPRDAIVFGSTVTLRNAAGHEANYRIAGVDEVGLEPDNVSWVSPLGKILLDAHLGQSIRLTTNDKTMWTVIRVESLV